MTHQDKAREIINQLRRDPDFPDLLPVSREVLKKAIAEALQNAEAEARERAATWQPIETALMGESGKPETYFIGARLDGMGKGRVSTATCYRNKHGAYEWWGGGLTPTHWMPIPPLAAAIRSKDHG